VRPRLLANPGEELLGSLLNQLRFDVGQRRNA
jgi:hypothetical protein